MVLFHTIRTVPYSLSGLQVTSDGINEGSGKMTAKEASILAWSFGALGLRPAGLYLVLARKGLATVHEATAHDLSNLAWGLARIGVLAAEEQTEDNHEGKGIKINVLLEAVCVFLIRFP